MVFLIPSDRCDYLSKTPLLETTLTRLYRRAGNFLKVNLDNGQNNTYTDWHGKNIILPPSPNSHTQLDWERTPVQASLHFLICSMEMMKAHSDSQLTFLNTDGKRLKYTDKLGGMLHSQIKINKNPFFFPHGDGELQGHIENLENESIKTAINTVAYKQKLKKNNYELNVIYRYILGEPPPDTLPEPANLTQIFPSIIRENEETEDDYTKRNFPPPSPGQDIFPNNN